MSKDDNFRYFLGEGPEVDALNKEVDARIKARQAAQKALIEEYGADTLVVNGDDWSPLAFGFKEETKAPRFLKAADIKDGFYLFEPDKRYKKGKELAEKFKDPKYAFSPRKYVLEKYGLFRMTFGNGHWYRSVVFWPKDNIMAVEIPVNTEDASSNDPWPEIPPFLREVKYSEFLAVQGK